VTLGEGTPGDEAGENGPVTDVLTRASGLPDAVVRYADHPDGLVDLHLPASHPRGIVVIIHGGFWRAEWDRRHTRPMAETLRAKGYVVATPEYRRTGAAGGAAGGWPQTFQDVRDAVTVLPGLLDGLGIAAPRPFVLLGHSAGGHLVLWLASEGVDVDRVVALAPVGDLLDAEVRDLDGGAVRDLLGGSSTRHPERYAAADPARRLAAPGANRPDVVVLHGTLDQHVPVANSDWAERAALVTSKRLDGVGHFELIDPEEPAWREVVAAVTG
jgi:acetyl esterase/lipase